ncbi:FUSC family protein [Natronoglycomyces albus]|uniref:FUSC family protein n=1 Tax=Natronoglycomyces albus TaxID=2811108 RepID=A0A895XNW1_9ACTN|nr:FUSC family protein [Natronoglycomyces albus]QSB04755.1 FUSC family protein [Natronoglycomyces albus]
MPLVPTTSPPVLRGQTLPIAADSFSPLRRRLASATKDEAMAERGIGDSPPDPARGPGAPEPSRSQRPAEADARRDRAPTAWGGSVKNRSKRNQNPSSSGFGTKRRREKVRRAATRHKISEPEPGHSLTGQGWQRSTLIGIRRDLTAWSTREFQPALVARTALGMVIVAASLPLFDGAGWVMAAILGAWVAGMGLLTPGTRTSAGVPLLIGLGAALSLLAGSVEPNWVFIVVTAVYALVLTYISSVSKAVGIIATICGVLFFFADQLTVTATPGQAALAVLAGAGVQAVLTLLPPYFRYADDRKCLSTAWRVLAADAESLSTNHHIALQTNRLHNAVAELDSRRRLPPALREARNDVYEVSGALTQVSAARLRAQLEGDAASAELYAEALSLAGRLLLYLANTVTAPRGRPVDWSSLLDELGERAIATPTGTIPGEVTGLLRILHRCDQYAERITRGESGIATSSPWRHSYAQLRAGARQLARNLKWSNPAVRFSLRRSLIVAGAVWAGILWPGNYGYWIPLTAWLVLQVDFYGTITKGSTRAVGTIAGVVVVSGVAIVLPHSLWVLTAAIIVFASLAYLTQPVSLAVFSAATAGLTVMLADLVGDDAVTAAWERGLASTAGAVAAIALYVVVPTWQTRRLPTLLADLIDAYSDYARLVLDHQAHPADHSAKRMRLAVDAVRSKRLALTNAAEQAEAEPLLLRPKASEAMGTEAALARAARALISVNASVKDDDTVELPAVDVWAQAIDAYYARLAALVRDEGDPPPPVDLEAASREFEMAVATGPPETRSRRKILRWEADQVADALQDASLIVNHWRNDERASSLDQPGGHSPHS